VRKSAVIIVIMIMIVVMIPISLRVPTMVGAAPVAMIGVPAALALAIQVAAPTLGLGASLPMTADGLIQPGFRLLNAMLAFPTVVIGACLRDRRQQQAGTKNNHRGPSSRCFRVLAVHDLHGNLRPACEIGAAMSFTN
jgi:hypothetical protein